MVNLKIFKTNAALGHRQYAYLIQINKNDFLCVYVDNNYHQDFYEIGEIVNFSTEDYSVYLEESDFDISRSPLHGTFLFKHFLNTWEHETIKI